MVTDSENVSSVRERRRTLLVTFGLGYAELDVNELEAMRAMHLGVPPVTFDSGLRVR